MIRATYSDRYRTRFGFSLEAWGRIVDLAIAYQQAQDGYDWPSVVGPLPLPGCTAARLQFYRKQRQRLLREEWAT